jgi:hypothetical protein
LYFLKMVSYWFKTIFFTKNYILGVKLAVYFCVILNLNELIFICF